MTLEPYTLQGITPDRRKASAVPWVAIYTAGRSASGKGPARVIREELPYYTGPGRRDNEAEALAYAEDNIPQTFHKGE